MLSPFFRTNFVKLSFLLLQSYTIICFHEIFELEFFRFFHTVINKRYHTIWLEIREIYSHSFLAKISWKQHFYLRNHKWLLRRKCFFYFSTILCIWCTIFFREIDTLSWNELIFREINRRSIIEKYFVKSTVRLCWKWLDFKEFFQSFWVQPFSAIKNFNQFHVKNYIFIRMLQFQYNW